MRPRGICSKRISKLDKVHCRRQKGRSEIKFRDAPVSALKAGTSVQYLQVRHSRLQTVQLTPLAAWKESSDLGIPVCQNHTPSGRCLGEAHASSAFVEYLVEHRSRHLPYLLLFSQYCASHELEGYEQGIRNSTKLSKFSLRVPNALGDMLKDN